MAAVLPESMDRLNVEDTRSSLSVIENYIRYMGECIEFSMRNVTRNVTEAGVSSAEMYVLVTAMSNSLSALQSAVNGMSGSITSLTNAQANMQDELERTQTQLGQTQGELEEAQTDLEEAQARLTETTAALEQLEESVDRHYPVGSLFLSMGGENPRDLLGFGTWEQVKDTFLLAAGDTYAAGETGGEAEHTLSKDEIPDHTHYIATTDEGAYDLPPWTIRLNSGTYVTSGREGAEDAACGYSSVGVGLGGQAHNNLPPYLAVFVWARTA